eukprot:TRINITY_DN17710_c0_g1_i1.p1 TRINITY_DN17710_c0_g1~~TRINITY_DN17710_c0_g1_i1.p1  ORF type:complete len:334 (-),score=30.72 TRINITY_DN17710_c0_g1_i1:89-1090(-)
MGKSNRSKPTVSANRRNVASTNRGRSPSQQQAEVSDIIPLRRRVSGKRSQSAPEENMEAVPAPAVALRRVRRKRAEQMAEEILDCRCSESVQTETGTSSSSSSGPSSASQPSAAVATKKQLKSDGINEGKDQDTCAEAAAIHDLLEDHLKCSICQDVLYRPTTILPCLHSFCSSCLGGYFSHGNLLQIRCPVCREPITRIAPNFQLEAVLSALQRSAPAADGTVDEGLQRRRTADANDPLRHEFGYDLVNYLKERGALRGQGCDEASRSVRASTLPARRRREMLDIIGQVDRIHVSLRKEWVKLQQLLMEHERQQAVVMSWVAAAASGSSNAL